MSTATEEEVRPPKPVVPYRDDWADNIPVRLKARKQWVVWAYVWREGKWTKLPFQPHAPVVPAKTNTPKTWDTFDQAVRAWQREPDIFAGVGFVFSEFDEFAGIDFDNCLGPDGEVLDWARPYLDPLAGAWGDISPSGRGIKYIVEATLPGTGTRKPGFGPDGSGAVECYDKCRFFTVVGNPIDTDGVIGPRQDYVDALYTGLKAKRPKPKAEANGHHHAPLEPLGIGDEELLAKARTAKKGVGEKFAAVYDRGDISAHGSPSEADFFLLCRLAWWTRKDPDRMERLWLASALGQREKTRERADYRKVSIANAIDATDGCYSPPIKTRAKHNGIYVEIGGTNGHATNGHATNGQAHGDGGQGQGAEAAPAEEAEFRNWELEEYHDEEDNQTKKRLVPLHQPAIIASLADLTNGGPMRVGSVLFSHDGGDDEPILFTNVDQLFASIASRLPVSWQSNGARYVPKRQFFEALRQSVRQFDAIERHPHFPPIPGVYYACSPVGEPGDGKALDGLLALYSPATEEDRELIRAFVYTLLWGGPPGKRPLFISEGPEGDPKGGRGVGKTELFAILAGLVGGTVSNVSARDDISAITKRIINDKARKRVVLLDNVKAERFSWGDFEGLITSPTVGAWLNYVGDEVRPNLLTYCMTINGASLSEDLAQRTVMIRLRRPESYDRDGEAWSDAIARYVAEHRGAIVADVAAAFARPAAEIKSHQRWASWTHGVLARCGNPFRLQNLILDRQNGINDDQAAADDFGRMLARCIRSHLSQDPKQVVRFAGQCGSDPNRAVVWISTDVLPPVVSSFTEEKVSLFNVSKKLNRFRPSELVKKDRNTGKGWLWIGRDADPSGEEFKWIWVGEGDGFAAG